MHFAKLACAAGLLLVPVLRGIRPGDRLAVRHLRRFSGDAGAKFRFRAADCHVDVLVAHAFEQCLFRRRFRPPVQSRVFFAQSGQRRAEFGRVGLRLRMHGHGVQRRRVGRHQQFDRVSLVAQRVAGHRQAQLRHRGNVARVQLLHQDLLFATHHVQRAQPLFRVPIVIPHAAVGT